VTKIIAGIHAPGPASAFDERGHWATVQYGGSVLVSRSEPSRLREVSLIPSAVLLARIAPTARRYQNTAAAVTHACRKDTLGCMMDSMAVVLPAIPVFYPLIQELDFNAIWFGILVVRVTEMGLITPLMGLNVFVIKAISGVPIGTNFRGIIPHLIADLLQSIILVMLPQFALWLPGLMN
jgi:Tripartite ATP-independent periplasmic transporter, DctM component